MLDAELDAGNEYEYDANLTDIPIGGFVSNFLG